MMKYVRKIKFLGLGLLLAPLLQCSKQNEWLEKKANSNDVILSTLDDYQALLDNESIVNRRYPGLGIVGSDNYYTTYPIWQSTSTEVERNAYLWLPDVFAGSAVNDWDSPYRIVALCNIAIEGIREMEVAEAEQDKKNQIMGSALFYRAYAFYNLLQLFAAPYGQFADGTVPGIPLRLSSDVNQSVGRSSLEDSYKQVISDLEKAAQLLREHSSGQTRPSGTVAKALLSRLFLNIGDYEKAIAYAEEVLNLRDELMDFNELTETGAFPFPGYPNNPEVLFYTETELYGITNFRSNRAFVDTALYRSYATYDLRKSIFYNASDPSDRVSFRGQYTGNAYFFGGIAINELYLIYAEALARLGNYSQAADILGKLLEKRSKREALEGLGLPHSENIVARILEERRKELPFTGLLRWEDLRRLNREGIYRITLARKLDGVVYSLPPNDNRYIYPIPEREMRLNPMEQNPR
ncbi:RagB/SusD family nutrient uptake outer membrane protein [Olivibacter sp. SA151]|uniref:RagB/SusD family nutrient uptake outer membrane protein n=1 Tax=Olivibacter jilunii TaxID=985016 RepID=UPI003F152ACB